MTEEHKWALLRCLNQNKIKLDDQAILEGEGTSLRDELDRRVDNIKHSILAIYGSINL